jgi:hypothetical protein
VQLTGYSGALKLEGLSLHSFAVTIEDNLKGFEFEGS